MQLFSGSSVGDYIVEGMLGSGGMAEVWAVRHPVTGERRALKLLTALHPALQLRLAREGRAQSSLQHDNLLPVEEILDIDGLPGLLMPLIEGPSLDVLLRDGGVSREAALSLLAEVTRGLAHAHSRGLIHRDIKPANILLDLEGGRITPRLADFGLVKSEDAQLKTRTGVLLGTPAYAAPEQLRSARRVDFRADLWSMGVLLVELLGGHRPFDGDSLVEILQAHALPPRLHGVPDDLRDLARSLLAVEPSQRTGSAMVLLRALEGHRRLGGDPLADESLWERLSARHRVVTIRGGSEIWDWLSQAEAAPFSPTTPNNLSLQRDRFIGRIDELVALGALLESCRLITLTGPGGAGKTRLSKQLGKDRLMGWPGGVWFVDLVEARTADDVVAAVSSALGIVPREDAAKQLCLELAARERVLLILDNFEQLLPLAEQTIGQWLTAAEAATIVVTSRAPTRLPEEVVFPVEPLTAEPAVALFLDRAQAMLGRVEVTPETRREVRELVALLDGLPLAIELAAARIRTLSPMQIRQRLSRRFALLKSRDERLPPRQRSLQATLRWSWDLLEAPEQAALAQCSVFEGGFTLEAAEAVLDLSAWPDADFLDDVLSELVARSLLVVREVDASRRFRMLVSIQAFATERLAERAEQDDAFRRHAAHFAALDRQEAPALRAAERAVIAAAQIRELDNLIAGSERSLRLGESALAARCALAAAWGMRRRGAFAAHRDLLEACIAEEGLSRARRARLHLNLSAVLLRLDEFEACFSQLNEALTLARDGGLRLLEGRVRNALSLKDDTLDEAQEHLEAALAIFQKEDSPADLGTTLYHLGRLHYARGNRAEARARYEESIPLFREAGLQEILGMCLHVLGMAVRHGGDPAGGSARQAEALAIFRETGNRTFQALSLAEQGLCAWAQGRLEDAGVLLEEALVLSRRVGNVRGEVAALSYECIVLRTSGHLERGIARCRALHRLASSMPSQQAIARLLEGELLCAMGKLEAAEGCLTEGLQIVRDGGWRSYESYALLTIADLRIRQARLEEALEWVGESLSISREIGVAVYEAQGELLRGRALRLLSRPEAQERLRSARGRLRGVQDLRQEAIACLELGLLADSAGDRDGAVRLLTESRSLAGQAGASRDRAEVLCRLARLRPDDAPALLAEAAELARALQDAPGTVLHGLLQDS